jgi:hypothetical protein
MYAIQMKPTTVAARVEAPSPQTENSAPARMDAGSVKRLGSHARCHAGFRRKAKARIGGPSRNAAPVIPDSILWACECHEVFRQPWSMPRQSRRKIPSRKRADARDDHGQRADPAKHVRAERAPEAQPEDDDEQARQVRTDLVVEPWIAGGPRPEVGDVVPNGAVGVRLRKAARDPGDVHRHEGDQSAGSGDAGGHGATLPETLPGLRECSSARREQGATLTIDRVFLTPGPSTKEGGER